MKIHVQSLHKNRLFAGWETSYVLKEILPKNAGYKNIN